MSLMLEVSGGETRTICPPGVYNAVCDEVFDLGLQPGFQGGPDKPKVVLLFELEKRIADGPLKGRRHQLARFVVNNAHEKSTLRAILRSWVGFAPASGSREQFDLRSLKGRPCTLTVIERVGTNGPKAIVTGIAAKMDKAEALTPEWDGETPQFVLDWMAKRLDRPSGPAPAAAVVPPAGDSEEDFLR